MAAVKSDYLGLEEAFVAKLAISPEYVRSGNLEESASHAFFHCSVVLLQDLHFRREVFFCTGSLYQCTVTDKGSA